MTLQVFKASAGSGKTYRLVLEYLKLAISGEFRHRYILAVTFTNKATAEMKERILRHLDDLASDRETPVLKDLMAETGLTEHELRIKARNTLRNLLFDYNRFSVSTIDKFTQKVLKAFNREIGVNPNYEVELDSELLVSEAVDRMVSEIGSNHNLRKWLEDFIEEKIRNGKNFTVENDLKKLGRELFKERLQIHLPELSDFFSKPGNDRDYLRMLNGISHGFENNLARMAKELVETYRKRGFSTDDFSYKQQGIAGFLEKTANGTIPPSIPQRALKAAETPEAWIAGKTHDSGKLAELVREKLLPGWQKMKNYFELHSRDYFTAKSIHSQWYTLAVMLDLNQEISKLGREKGILPIAGSNLLLKRIINGNETPFVYERTGNQFHHFLIDEFQDTSTLQWENFRPLISNALAAGYKNMVVGDAKQSIYRWRNSDWTIIADQVFNDFPGFDIKTELLGTNFRSRDNIIDFNNDFFGHLAQSVARYDKAGPVKEPASAILGRIYRDVVQEKENRSEKRGGFVRITRLHNDDETFAEMSLYHLPYQVKELFEKGFRPADIAILVRKNDQGEKIVRHFQEIAGTPEFRDYNMKIVSGESFFLKTSPSVNFIILLLRYLTGRDDTLTKAMILHIYRNHILPSRNKNALNCADELPAAVYVPGANTENDFSETMEPLLLSVRKEISTSSIDEIIIRICAVFGLFGLGNELSFLQTFIDKASDVKKNSAGNIPEFLDWWDEKGVEAAISPNEETEAIRLLTIHKSKGLQFEAVLIPFLDWEIIDKNEKIIWCEPQAPPFSRVPVVPVVYGPGLANTIFEKAYYIEMINLLVDNLNLIYVAFTRAISLLSVNLPIESGGNKISSFMEEALKMTATKYGIESRKGDSLEYVFGDLPHFAKKNSKREITGWDAWSFNDFSGRLKIRTGQEEFLVRDEWGRSRKNSGRIIHHILSRIKTADETDQAIKEALGAGMIFEGEEEAIARQIRQMTSHPVAGEWFTGKWKVMTETSLLTPRATWRPDRMMFSEQKAIVVDFKSGMERKESHRLQVKMYAETLKQAGFSDVSGYIWYIRENDLVKI
jgi:ATP-dependent exoDNAse (exonuclease V) beta subunit